jgi:hypothetical protein
MSAVTGYLIAAYLVGAKLTRSQLVIVSTLFIVFSLIMSLTGFSLMERAIQLEVEFEGSRDALDDASYFLLLIQVLGILAALKFMLDIRHTDS